MPPTPSTQPAVPRRKARVKQGKMWSNACFLFGSSTVLAQCVLMMMVWSNTPAVVFREHAVRIYAFVLVANVLLALAIRFRIRRIPRAIRRLGNPLASSRDKAKQEVVAPGADAIPALIELLSVPGTQRMSGWFRWDGEAARRMAAECLGELKAAEAVDPLIEALDDSDDELVMKAATALAAIGDPRAVPAIVPLLGRERNFKLKTTAEEALRSLGETELVNAWTLAVVAGQCQDWSLLHRHSDAVIQALMAVLREGQSSKLVNVVAGLTELKAVCAVSHLRVLLRRVDVEREILQKAPLLGARIDSSSQLLKACRAALDVLEPLYGLPRSAEGAGIVIDTLPRPASSVIAQETLPRAT